LFKAKKKRLLNNKKKKHKIFATNQQNIIRKLPHIAIATVSCASDEKIVSYTIAFSLKISFESFFERKYLSEYGNKKFHNKLSAVSVKTKIKTYTFI
jgi:hypothetical protein